MNTIINTTRNSPRNVNQKVTMKTRRIRAVESLESLPNVLPFFFPSILAEWISKYDKNSFWVSGDRLRSLRTKDRDQNPNQKPYIGRGCAATVRAAHMAAHPSARGVRPTVRPHSPETGPCAASVRAAQRPHRWIGKALIRASLVFGTCTNFISSSISSGTTRLWFILVRMVLETLKQE